MNIIHGMWPGVVSSYTPGARMCRVEIPGVTDGSDVRPEAVFNNSLGDNAETTEIRILPGDPVWLMFEGGDPRFPIIMGYRTPRTGNPTGWRRWQHANIQLTAENTLLITVGSTTITITDGLVHVQGADMHLAQNLIVDGQAMVAQNLMVALGISAGTNVVATANIADQGGTKSMSDIRTKFNTHGGHYDSSNRIPDNLM